MTAIQGRQAKIGIDVHNTFGTATAATRAIMVDSLSGPKNVTKLMSSQVGSGESMYGNMEQGAIDPQMSISMKAGYNNGFAEMLAVFFGTSAAPTEQTASQGDYLHVIKFNTTRLANYLTIAAHADSSNIFEWPDVAWSEVVLNFQGPFPNYVTADFNGLASNRVDSGWVNSYAGLTALTAPAHDEVVARPGTSQNAVFRINADSGAALGSGDVKNITSAVVTFTDGLERISEMKNSAGNSAPAPTDLFMGTLTVNFRDLADFTYYAAAAAGTTYKADIQVLGAQIGSGLNKKLNPNFPLLKVIDDPEFTYASPGRNEHIVTFEMLKRSANPTGMADSYPFVNIINNLSTSLLA